MKRILTIAITLLTIAGSAWAQKAMTPPHVMVVPDMIYCKAHGFTQQFNNNGTTETIPDYEKALSEDPTLHSVLIQVAQLITDRNPDIVIVDLLEAINQTKANGPQYQVSYTITGTDAYTSRMFAPIEGMGAPSTSANPVVLLREAVYQNMDAFLTKVLQYYQGMVTKGRMVAFDIKTTESATVNMNTKIGQYALHEIIEDFLFDNSVDGNGTERVKSGATFMQYQGVYIPLISTIRGRQRKQGAKDVALKLVNELSTKGVNADYKVRGLGKVNIYIK